MNKKEKNKSQVMLKYVLFVSLIACLTGTNMKISAQNETATEQPQPLIFAPQEQQINVNEEILVWAEQIPEFPGGLEALSKYISDNLKYPEEAQENGVQERIVLRFVVEKDGSVSDVTVLRGKDPNLKKEAIRVIQSLPKFEPGRQNGKPVRVYFTLPINFKLGVQEPPVVLQQEPQADTDEEVFVFVEQIPEFPGGMEALYKFISTNIRYPMRAMEKGIQEKITVRFIIEKDGSVSNITVLRGENKDLIAEAVRVVQLLPKFVPGRQDGKPVRVYYTFPINFKISKG